MQITLLFTPHASDFAHDSLFTIFSVLPRIAFASIVAYVISQKHDVWAYAKWKKKYNKIFISNNLSTLVSQSIDSLIFTIIAFLGVLPLNVMIQIFISTYILKTVIAILDTPFVYLAKSSKLD